MAKLKITTKTCPLCRYTYKRMQKYEMVEKEINPAFDFSLVFDDLKESKNVKKTKLVEECTEDKIIQGDEDFKYVYHNNTCMIEHNDYFVEDKIIGMFCPKCGILLNDNTCTKYEEEEI